MILAPSQMPPTNMPTENDENASDGGTVPPDVDGTPKGNDPNESAGAVEGEGSPVPANNNNSLSNGAIVGVSVAGVALLLAIAFFVSRRRTRKTVVKAQDKYLADIDIAGDESIFTEDSAAFKYIPKEKMGSFYSTHSEASKCSKHSSRSGSSVGRGLPKDVLLAPTGVTSRSVAQFDPSNAAAAIALGIDGQIIRRDSVASSHRSSPASSLDEGKHGKMKNLTDAIEHGDWDAVARLAGSMASSSEEVSTISDYSTAREQLSSRGSLSSKTSGDSVRVAQIEEMVHRGDWSGVATAAQYFSSSKSQGSGSRSGVARSTAESPKRSFIDFVTGRQTMPSAAATAAIVPNSPDLVEQDSDRSDLGAHVGVVEGTHVSLVAIMH